MTPITTPAIPLPLREDDDALLVGEVCGNIDLEVEVEVGDEDDGAVEDDLAALLNSADTITGLLRQQSSVGRNTSVRIWGRHYKVSFERFLYSPVQNWLTVLAHAVFIWERLTESKQTVRHFPLCQSCTVHSSL
jgi:hypothetical protein